MSILNELSLNRRLLKNVQILVVENDRDSRDMYAFLLESYGATVTTIGSVKDALDWLNDYIPDILICEARFLGESVYPLIQNVRSLGRSSGRTIPIVVTSTFSLKSLAQQLTVKIEAYLPKPINIGYLLDWVWTLTLCSAYPLSLQYWLMKQEIGKLSYCIAGVS